MRERDKILRCSDSQTCWFPVPIFPFLPSNFLRMCLSHSWLMLTTLKLIDCNFLNNNFPLTDHNFGKAKVPISLSSYWIISFSATLAGHNCSTSSWTARHIEVFSYHPPHHHTATPPQPTLCTPLNPNRPTTRIYGDMGTLRLTIMVKLVKAVVVNCKKPH